MTATVPSKQVKFGAYLEGADNEMVGDSPGLQNVREAVQMVAPMDTAVLICGETGTGKERVARSVHELSPRRDAPYVTVNCAAIPAGLIESELFGHERGAFTGAFTQTAGKFQLAHQGTIFLDEIGDLPLDLQPKLLRVLQEQEFERLGSHRTTRVNVRVVAATNLDLAQMVRERRFRADLFYRVNVFPIVVPPLRERRQDIPALVWHFIKKFSTRAHKNIAIVPDDVMQSLQWLRWPGNIRELQNFVERAVILSPGPVLRLPPMEVHVSPPHIASTAAGTLAEVERDHILNALEQTGWVVGGRRGAAVRLGLPRTTLTSRMAKLGIERTIGRPGELRSAAAGTGTANWL